MWYNSHSERTGVFTVNWIGLVRSLQAEIVGSVGALLLMAAVRASAAFWATWASTTESSGFMFETCTPTSRNGTPCSTSTLPTLAAMRSVRFSFSAPKDLKAAEKSGYKTLTDFLDQDPTGTRKMVYRMQVLQELTRTANANGHNTIFLTDLGGQSTAILPLPSGR